MAERLNLHIDETGNQDLSEGRYLVAVVLHDHSADIEDAIARYRSRLSGAGLPDVPFHGKDLLHGNEGYANVSPGDRKRLLTKFPALFESSRSRFSHCGTTARPSITEASSKRG